MIGKYRIGRVIGKGSFATVKIGTDLFTSETVAIKIVDKYELMNNKTGINLLNQEIDVMRRLNHPGIIRLIEVIEDDSAYYIVMEYCGGGELFDFIISRKRVEEPLAQRFFKQIVLSIDYLHQQDIAHRDLKPENLLLTGSNVVKVIDFGLCSVNASEPLTNRCGSPCYIAPESLTQTSWLGKPTDIWALGVILYALVNGNMPWNYQQPDTMLQEIINGDFAQPGPISDECYDMLRCMLNPDPTRRFTCQDILNHVWLKSVGNVFPEPKPVNELPAPRLSLNRGGFSQENLRHDFQLQPLPSINMLDTIYEDSTVTPNSIALPHKPDAITQLKRKSNQPRSVSYSELEQSSIDNSGDQTNSHKGVIFGQTINDKNPEQVASKLILALAKVPATYNPIGSLKFQITFGDVLVDAEVCKLYGFRNVHVLRFKRLQGDGWKYTQFVQNLLSLF